MSGEPVVSTRPKPTPRTAPPPQLVGEGSKIPSTTPQPESSKKITKLIPQILLSKRRSKISVKSGSGKSGKSGTSGTSFSQSDIDSMRSAKYEELDMQEEAETRALQYRFKELRSSYSRFYDNLSVTASAEGPADSEDDEDDGEDEVGGEDDDEFRPMSKAEGKRRA